MIQKGDNFLCKNTNNFLEEGNYYNINNVIKDDAIILVDIGFTTNKLSPVGIVLVISLDGDYDYRRNSYFYNTFYTKKEERKLKLKKIENRC